jgi:hypothetical protein
MSKEYDETKYEANVAHASWFGCRSLWAVRQNKNGMAGTPFCVFLRPTILRLFSAFTPLEYRTRLIK